MTEFYAQPYSIDHTGFYFDSIETFESGMKKLNARGCEEVEIQFIDGDCHLANLAQNITVYQNTVDFWFEELDHLDETQVTQILVLLDCGHSLEDALERYDDVCLFEGTASDYAYELINDTTEVPESLSHYIDYEAIARDMQINGEIIEINHELLVTNAYDF